MRNVLSHAKHNASRANVSHENTTPRKLTEADVTPESIFYQRRKVLQALGITAATLALPTSAQADLLALLKAMIAPKPLQASRWNLPHQPCITPIWR